MANPYKFQQLDIAPDWTVRRNVFYDIDPKDNISEEDKYHGIYCQEDMLYLTKGEYYLDLGWYGEDNLNSDNTGYCIHLFRGESWLKASLLEKIRSQNKQFIVDKIAEFTRAVDLGEYDDLVGYKVDDEDLSNENHFGDFDIYSVR